MKHLFLTLSASIVAIASYGQVRHSFALDSLTIWTNANLENLALKVKSTELTIYPDKNRIPRQVSEQLALLTKDKFSITNSTEEYRCCCTSPKTLPTRKLQFLAIGHGLLAMTYLTGGDGESTHVLLVKYDNAGIIDVWAGISLIEVKTKKDLIRALIDHKKEKYNLYWSL